MLPWRIDLKKVTMAVIIVQLNGRDVIAFPRTIESALGAKRLAFHEHVGL